ncbi:MAG: hypothetical protein FIB01_02105 [Gemmatimonadetes bacterium]|nr:hypothetical protein [Gemmatimonadota bacterium]
MLSTTLLTVLALAAAPQAQDPHWYAFEGCWRVTPQQEGAPVVCMAESAGVLVMSTYVKGELKSEQRIRADGVARPISEGGCNGEETGRWSADGARVYISARLSCGSGMERLTSGVLALTGPESFVEVRSLRVADGITVRTVRYAEVPASEYPAGFRLAAGRELVRETTRLHASTALDVADVAEASKLVDAGAVEALLATRASGFALNAKTLRQLKAAGVPRSTLDLMVALSYPDAFRVAESEPREPNRADYASPYYDPFLMNPYYRYDCFGLNYYSSWACDYRYGYGYGYGSYGYSPYGYSRYGGWYSPYGWYGNNGIIVVPAGEDQSAGGAVGSGGYSRGTQPSLGTARSRGQSSGNAGTRSSVSPSSGGGSSSRGGSSSGGGGSSGGSVGGGGYSSGGSSGSVGTAKPRGGG